MTPTLASQTLSFLWRHSPDLALEAGRLPPVPWESVSATQRVSALEEAGSLIRQWEASRGQDPKVSAAAAYHLRSAQSSIRDSDLGILNHMTGPAARLEWAARSWPRSEDPDCHFYIERLRAFPAYCSQLIDESKASGRTDHVSRPVLQAFVTQVNALVRAHGRGGQPLLKPIEDAGARGHTPPQAPVDLLQGVLSSLLRLKSMARSLMPSAHPSSPWPSTEGGSERYADAIFRGTSLELAPGTLGAMGTEILSETSVRFGALRESTLVSSDAHCASADLLDRFQSTYSRLATALPSVCAALPSSDCDVLEMPEAFASMGPPAFYWPSSHRGGRNGALYVNTTGAATPSQWEVLPLAMHEGVPGHHLQSALVDEDETIPELIRLLPINAVAEGWAVYAETLAREMGIALVPSDELGLLAHQRWRAARLVVDVGLHAHGWSVEQGTAFIADATSQDRRLVQREVVRYLAWPGQALGYSVGARAMASWVRARSRGGASLPDTHAALIRLGFVPLSFLTPM